MMRTLVVVFLGALIAATPDGVSAQQVRGWVFVGGDSAELSSMGSCWRFPRDPTVQFSPVGICGDAIPENSLARAAARALTVAPGSALDVRFIPSATSLTVYDRPTLKAITNPHAPDSAGTYLFNVGAKWPNGEGSWVFQVKVDPSKQRNDTTEILATIQRLFDAMASRDTALARAQLVRGMTLAAVQTGTAAAVPRVQADTSFLRALATGTGAKWIERIWTPTIHIEGQIASVWAPYDFHNGATWSHCGIDTFTLMRTASGWQIATLAYTVQRQSCAPSPLGPPRQN